MERAHNMAEIWIGLCAIFATIGVGLLTIWAVGDAQRKKRLHDRIDEIDVRNSKRIERCKGEHVHVELCNERSGNIKNDVNNIKAGA